MCGRTSLFAPEPEIERRFEAAFDHDYERRYNVAPGSTLAVVHDADPGTITRDGWGFVPEWADSLEAGPRPINARAESLEETDLFRSAVENRRALVLADGYYEWAGTRGGKQPYRIAMEEGDLFAMAGLWSRVHVEKHPHTTVAVVTRNATERLSHIHDRMPAILDRDAESAWLEGPPERATSLLGPAPDQRLEATPVSTLVNDPANDSPAVIEGVGGDSGQTGLEDFGAD